MRRRGFTLVELVAVVTILGILLLIAIPGINITLVNSRKDAFKITCDKIYAMDEKYDLYQDLEGTDYNCVVFDFDNDYEKTEIIDGVVYEPLSKIGLENEEGIHGQFKICKNKELKINNGEFTCIYDKNNEKVLATTEQIDFPVLRDFELRTDRDQIAVYVSAEGAEKYYYKLDNGEFIESDENTYTFKNLKVDTEYKVTVYVEKTVKKETLKSNEKTKTTKTKDTYYGLEDKEYEDGEEVTYAGVDFLVVKDNGDTVTLITKNNVKTDKFGNTSSWNDSPLKPYLNESWANENAIIKHDIEKGGIIYDDESSSYIRMIRRNELHNKIPNGSKTPFWTMTTSANDVFYALKNASSQYTKYSLGTDTEATYYQGEDIDLTKITKKFTKNEVVETNVDTKALPTSTSAQIGDLKSVSTSVTGKENYTERRTTIQEDCNCRTEDTDCHNIACNSTSYSTQTISDSYCQGSACAGSKCAGSACAGSACAGSACAGSACAGSRCASNDSDAYSCVTSTCASSKCTYKTCASKDANAYSCITSKCASERGVSTCAGYASTSCGRTSCGQHQASSKKCNTYTHPRDGAQVTCGWAYYQATDYCDKNCRANCTKSEWDHNECVTSTCASSTCTKSACASKNSTAYSCVKSACASSTCTKSTCTSSTCSKSTCTGSTCSKSTCTGLICTGSTCSKFITTSKSEKTYTSIITSTCRTCDSTRTVCETCNVLKTIYEASGKNVTYSRYNISETTDVLGVRAVITVRKRKNNS